MANSIADCRAKKEIICGHKNKEHFAKVNFQGLFKILNTKS